MYVRLATGQWRQIPGPLTESDDGYLLPLEEFAGLAPAIAPDQLLTAARKLVRVAHRRRWHVRHARLNDMRLELARGCIDCAILARNVIYC